MTSANNEEEFHQPNRGDIEPDDPAHIPEDESPHQGEPGYYDEEEQCETNVQIIEREEREKGLHP